ncbi:hypothetical protein Pfra02_04840 [Pseudomonas fragi]|nr:hypothetical protein Pfra02_04840 [Pseudomonas fragi]
MSGIKFALAALVVAAVLGCSTAGKVVSTVGSVVYSTAHTAVVVYCSKSEAERAVIQLVVSGHAYSSELCPIVNGDTSIAAELAEVTQDKAADVVNGAVERAVADGSITESQAEQIISPVVVGEQ